MTFELALSTLGCALLCYTLGRYNRTLTLQRWQFVLNAPEKQAIDSLRQRMQLDSALARQAFESAGRAREADRHPDALTVLRVALSILEDAGADRLTRLRAMSVYSRMVRAIKPLPPLSPKAFRGTELRATASVAGLVHHFLVGAEERFRLWLLVLGLGVRIVLRGGRRSAEAATRGPQSHRPWEAFARGIDDFDALDSSHLTAFEALVASLSAVTGRPPPALGADRQRLPLEVRGHAGDHSRPSFNGAFQQVEAEEGTPLRSTRVSRGS
jgi:hypothetical protein